MNKWILVSVSLICFSFLACTKKEKTPEAGAPTPELTLEEKIARGQNVYIMTCSACHNQDPRKDGSIGPAIAGSSEALIEARVMRAEYPAGYTPKRSTKAMAALPFMKDDLPFLNAYLNTVK